MKVVDFLFVFLGLVRKEGRVLRKVRVSGEWGEGENGNAALRKAGHGVVDSDFGCSSLCFCGSFRGFFSGGSLFSGSFCLCCSLSFSSGLSSGGLLFGYLLGDFGVGGLFCLEASFECLLLVFGELAVELSGLAFLLLLPSVELGFSSSFVESTLLHTATEVLHEENALVGEDVANGVGGLCTAFYPVKGALKVEVDRCRMGVGVVSTELFSELTVAGSANVGDYDAVESIALTAMTLQANTSCHV